MIRKPDSVKNAETPRNPPRSGSHPMWYSSTAATATPRRPSSRDAAVGRHPRRDRRRHRAPQPPADGAGGRSARCSRARGRRRASRSSCPRRRCGRRRRCRPRRCATRRAATLAVISGSNPKRSSSIVMRLDDLAPEDLVAGLHVGEVEVGEHVRQQRQELVAERVPEVQHAVRAPRQEARPVHDVGLAGLERLEQLAVLGGVVLEVGVLDDRRSRRVASAKPARSAAPLPWFTRLRERPRTRGSSTVASTSAVPSVEPSSTTITSATHGDASTRWITSCTVACSLKQGTTTDRHGLGGGMAARSYPGAPERLDDARRRSVRARTGAGPRRPRVRRGRTTGRARVAPRRLRRHPARRAASCSSSTTAAPTAPSAAVEELIAAESPGSAIRLAPPRPHAGKGGGRGGRAAGRARRLRRLLRRRPVDTARRSSTRVIDVAAALRALAIGSRDLAAPRSLRAESRSARRSAGPTTGCSRPRSRPASSTRSAGPRSARARGVGGAPAALPARSGSRGTPNRSPWRWPAADPGARGADRRGATTTARRCSVGARRRRRWCAATPADLAQRARRRSAAAEIGAATDVGQPAGVVRRRQRRAPHGRRPDHWWFRSKAAFVGIGAAAHRQRRRPGRLARRRRGRLRRRDARCRLEPGVDGRARGERGARPPGAGPARLSPRSRPRSGAPARRRRPSTSCACST